MGRDPLACSLRLPLMLKHKRKSQAFAICSCFHLVFNSLLSQNHRILCFFPRIVGVLLVGGHHCHVTMKYKGIKKIHNIDCCRGVVTLQKSLHCKVPMEVSYRK